MHISPLRPAHLLAVVVAVCGVVSGAAAQTAAQTAAPPREPAASQARLAALRAAIRARPDGPEARRVAADRRLDDGRRPSALVDPRRGAPIAPLDGFEAVTPVTSAEAATRLARSAHGRLTGLDALLMIDRDRLLAHPRLFVAVRPALSAPAPAGDPVSSSARGRLQALTAWGLRAAPDAALVASLDRAHGPRLLLTIAREGLDPTLVPAAAEVLRDGGTPGGLAASILVTFALAADAPGAAEARAALRRAPASATEDIVRLLARAPAGCVDGGPPPAKLEGLVERILAQDALSSGRRTAALRHVALTPAHFERVDTALSPIDAVALLFDAGPAGRTWLAQIPKALFLRLEGVANSRCAGFAARDAVAFLQAAPEGLGAVDQARLVEVLDHLGPAGQAVAATRRRRGARAVPYPRWTAPGQTAFRPRDCALSGALPVSRGVSGGAPPPAGCRPDRLAEAGPLPADGGTVLRAEATLALAMALRLEPDRAAVRGWLAAAVQDADPWVATQAALGILRVDGAHSAARARLAKAPVVLGRFWHHAASAAALEALSTHPDADVRQAAARVAAERSSSPPTVDPAAALKQIDRLADPDPAVAQRAARALGGPADPAVAAAVRRRWTMLKALAVVGHRPARRAALSLLARYAGDRADDPALLGLAGRAALADDAELARHAQALFTTTRAARRQIRRARVEFTTDPAAWVDRLRTLKSFDLADTLEAWLAAGPPHPDAVAAVRPLLWHRDRSVARAAAAVVAGFDPEALDAVAADWRAAIRARVEGLVDAQDGG